MNRMSPSSFYFFYFICFSCSLSVTDISVCCQGFSSSGSVGSQWQSGSDLSSFCASGFPSGPGSSPSYISTVVPSGQFSAIHFASSTGLYNATPRGTYQISTKYLWRELYGGVYGQYATRIHGGILFHSVPYYKRAKDTLCTDKYNKLGQQASMGCVRLTVEDAKWIAL